MNKPDFFMVGAPKCGTTAMHEYLNKHPEIFMAPGAAHFFASDPLGNDRANRAIQTLPEYLALFENARGEKRIGERSVMCLCSRAAAQEIKAFNPAGRIIAMLRNPVDMMYAWYSQAVWTNHESAPSFEAALEEEAKWYSGSHQGQRLPWLRYREIVKYAPQVQRYFDTFGRENVHIIIYDDFKKDTRAVYRDTLRFLDVDPDFHIDLPVVNASHRARSMPLQRFLLNQPKPLLRMIPSRLRKFVGGGLIRLNTVYEARTPMDPELRRRLLIEFESEVEELSTLLRRDLSSWCKTRVMA